MFQQLSEFINMTSFYTGAVMGAGVVCAVFLVGRFLVHHWKALLIGSAVVSGVSLAVIAMF